ncbi:uncharacterized protein KY384_000831 [Bacidia gigantensis]|uniref:uncharacterized protein n=1 Tax=Bacidia gigantensis TaxID=2732470 RepID=UPI001D04DA2F|nr:uncharacterized protein KY384_000831 [Bacidia gigantensis]KAG8526069.1 hypothetical protein KY384_000831 [Bacidia gigantensis]
MRFPVHKAVLSSQSDYFNSMFQRDWKENAQGEVELKEDVSFVVEAMIQFMYYADYERPAIESYDYEFEFLFDAQVYVIAEKYGLPDLKQRAQEKFSSQQTYEPGETRFTSKIAYFSEAVEVIL